MQELIAIQQNGPKELGFFGTRNMGFLHQNLIEILSYAMVLTVRFSARPVLCIIMSCSCTEHLAQCISTIPQLAPTPILT